MGKWDFLEEELKQLKASGLYNYIRTIESAQGEWIQVNGRKVLNLCSNNYLGFANDPELKKAAKDALEKYGVGPAAVRSIAGTLDLHEELEKKLAEFKDAPATLSFQSGFNTNLGVIQALVGEGDVIYSDELNHASVIDGCRLSRARIVRYPHCDPEGLRKLLGEENPPARRRLIITDGVFSMDGDIAPLPELVQVAEEFGAILMVDDAHGEGVLGKGGRGITDHFGLHGKVDLEVGTLSKAFGVVGGYVAGAPEVIEFLRQRARPFLFSSAVTAADTAACIRAVEILASSEDRVKKLWENTRYFQSRLKELGFDLGKTQTPITPVHFYEETRTQKFAQRLWEEGIFAMAIVYPTVPRGKARIRCMLSAAHSREALDFAIDVFSRLREEKDLQ
ncbi:MAG: glycine C-acetyltransferase [bacterium JZ-2024 1]